MNKISSLALLSFIFHCLLGKTVEESDTGALLRFPNILDEELYGAEWEVSPAQFGYQQYGGNMTGVLVLPANQTYHLECDGGEPDGINPYIHWIKDQFVDEDDIKDFIMIIDRLDCYFVEKVEVAQRLGASGVIICDKRQENLFTMWMPQDWTDDIDIPAVLLQEANCEVLYKHLGVQGWTSYVDAADLTYPSVYNFNWTIASIEWGLPHDDDRVEWELWTSSNDLLGSEFKKNFDKTAIILDHANDTIFTPHMYILAGSHWGCDDSSLPCKKQCSNTGRYCAVDPEYDLSAGLDGLDVIQENLRSLCVYKFDVDNFDFDGLIDDVMWWDYVELFDNHCGILSNATDHSLTFHVNCSYAQMEKLLPTELRQYVEQCIENSGGYGYNDGINTILERETKLRENSSIYALPMVRVNEFLIHGNIDCPPPVTVQSCEVLSAICAGFMPGTLPDICSLTPAPTMVTCEETDKDCMQICYGEYKIDECGNCTLTSSSDWNFCVGCNDKPDDSTFDCAGTCGGHWELNPCSYCLANNQSDFITYGQDCSGSCDTEHQVDECGHCMKTDNSSWNACVGCDGAVDSGKIYNDCGLCLYPSEKNFDSAGKDCQGICSGIYEYDLCGECNDPSDDDRNACLGCDGVANSNTEYNPCGHCILSTAADFDDYGKDCSSECPTSVKTTHYIDECGNCLLTSDSSWNGCVKNGTIVIENTEVTTLKKKESELTLVIVVVCIVAFLVIVAACVIIGALWRKQGQIDDRFKSLAATYQVMDENPNHSINVGNTKSKKGRQTIPDEEELDD